jgi:hypothetical protein
MGSELKWLEAMLAGGAAAVKCRLAVDMMRAGYRRVPA